MLKLMQELPSSEQEHVTPCTTRQDQDANTELPSPATTKEPHNCELISVHLSNERMFLAWTWTGMMLMGFGVAIAKMRIAMYDFSQSTGATLQLGENHDINPVTMGMMFLVVGIATILMSAYRYLVVQNQLRKQTYTHADTFVLIFMLALMLLSGTLVLLLLHMR